MNVILTENGLLARRMAKSLLAALALGFMSSVLADQTTLTIADATQSTSSAPVTMLFPVTRSGDLAYEAVLNYHTIDGTALAGTDYSAVSGTLAIPAGAASATIPVTVAARGGTAGNLVFQLGLDGAAGVGPAPSFSAPARFAIAPFDYNSGTVADVNGDGRPDLIVANLNENTVSVLINTTAPGATTPTFAAPVPFATGTRPFSVAAADVNGDGKIDLFVDNGGSNTISILINTTAPGAATPTFAAQQTVATAGLITLADINGDGKPDLILTQVGNQVAVLINTTAPGAATPTFATQQTFATGTNPSAVTIADVDGDGKPDLLIANQDDNTISVLLNTTAPGADAPSLAAQQTFATGRLPTSVAAIDVNGDGRPDMIVTNAYGPNTTASILLNTSAPGASTLSFSAQQTFPTGTTPLGVTMADVNGDGKPDAIVANNASSVSVLSNTTVPGATTPNFAAQQAFAVAGFPISVTTADFNGDGLPDLFVMTQDGPTVLLNTTTPSAAALNFAVQQIVAPSAGPYIAATADVNGDGKPDLFIVNNGDNTVSVLLNTTAPGAIVSSFGMLQSFATGSGPRYAIAADLNGDGKPDLAVANTSGNTVSTLLNTTAAGATTPTFTAQQTFVTGTSPISIAAADINRDGKLDLIVTNAGSNTVSVLLNTALAGDNIPSFAAQQTFATGSVPYSVTSADINSDGKPDLVVTNQSDATISVLLNTTAPGATIPSFSVQQTFATGTLPHSVTAVDVNGDGKLDLIVANAGSFPGTVSVLLNTTVPGAATASFASQRTFAANFAPQAVTATDLDGDGKMDLIVADGATHNVSVLLNTTIPGASTPSFGAPRNFSSGGNGAGHFSAAVADINGDGRPDLVVANTGDNTVSVLLNTQYQSVIAGSPATGTIVHDYIFANGFE